MPIVNERLNKLASWSEISFQAFLIIYLEYFMDQLLCDIKGWDNQFNFFSACLWEEKGIRIFICELISEIFIWIFYFSLGLLADSTELITENICNSFWIIYSFSLKSKYSRSNWWIIDVFPGIFNIV